MAASVVFENATIAEAVRRIERIAPKKGEAFDKASGIVFDIDPTSEFPVQMRATNLETYYREWVGALEAQGEPTSWRLPSMTLASIVAKLPIGSSRNVRFSVEGNRILEIQSGRFKAKLGMVPVDHYPSWEPFDPSSMSAIDNLGTRIEQVAWATAKGVPGSAIAAVRLNGSGLVATDRYRLASVPLEIAGLEGDLVVPLGNISSLIKEFGAVKVGVSGNMLTILPNDFTQIMCNIYEAQFPNVERVIIRDHPEHVTVNKNHVIEVIERVIVADSKNRIPEMEMYIGSEELAFFVKESDGLGSAGDALEIAGQATHPRTMIRMNPMALTECLTAAPGDNVQIHYRTDGKFSTVRVTAAHGFESWLVPLVSRTES